MPYSTSTRCSICQSKHRLETEQMRAKENLTYKQISERLNEKHGFKVSYESVHRHFKNHFEYISDEMALVAQESRKLFDESVVDAGNRASKLSGMVHASYKYVTEHFDELEMKTALQMLFGSIDQLNKMEGTGAFAGADFLMKFQELLESIKRGNVVQPTLIFTSNELGEAEEEPNQCITDGKPVDNSDSTLSKNTTT